MGQEEPGPSSWQSSNVAGVDAQMEEPQQLREPYSGESASSPGKAGSWPVGLVAYLVTVWLLVTLNFLLPRAMPGDPISTMVDAQESPAGDREELRAELAAYYGLDQPLVEQYGSYLGDLARGDLGTSIRYHAPVTTLIGERLPWTLLLAGTAGAMALAVGLAVGVNSGWRRGRSVDRGLLLTFISVRNIPVFFLAALMLLIFAVKLGWMPVGGRSTPFAENMTLPGQVIDVAHYLVLPASVLAVQLAAGYYLLMRAGMVSQLGADYLTTGQAKGLGERALKYRYAARNAILPVVTVTALQLGFAVTGSIFVETVFAYQGMGLLLFEAVGSRDYPTLQGCFLVFSVAVVSVNYAADALYARLDPRTRS
jgi:peptide/nickel transport system permease protein